MNNHTTPAPADTPAAALLAAADFFEGHQWHSDGASYDKGRDAAIVWVVSTLRKRAAAVSAVRPPATDPTLRERLLDALDFAYCQGLGYETPEALLAAYDATRVPPPATDRTALREQVAEALLTTRRSDYAEYGVKANHRQHRFDTHCASPLRRIFPAHTPAGGYVATSKVVGSDCHGPSFAICPSATAQPPRLSALIAPGVGDNFKTAEYGAGQVLYSGWLRDTVHG